MNATMSSKSSISVNTQVHLHKFFILPSVVNTAKSSNNSQIGLMHMTCGASGRYLCIPYTCHVTNVEVRSVMACLDTFRLVHMRRFQVFSCLARRPGEEDHSRVLVGAMNNLSLEKTKRTSSGYMDKNCFPSLETTRPGILLQIIKSGINWLTPLHSSRSSPTRRRQYSRLITQHTLHLVLWCC